MKKENTKSVKERRAEAKKKAELKKNLKYAAIIAVPVILIALVIVAAFVGKSASTMEVEYSKGLDENGKIAGINVGDYVELCDFSNLVFQEPEVAMTDEDWEEFKADLMADKGIEELTDEYIAENYSEYATTVAEYETYIRELAEAENIKTKVLDYLVENSKVSSLPKKYYKITEDNFDEQYKIQYNYYNNMYYQFLGYYNWNSYLDYYEMTKSEYKNMVKEAATDAVTKNLILQAAFEQMGLTLTEEDINEAIYEAGYEIANIDSAIEEYGMPYWKQFSMTYKVINEIADTVRIN